MNDSIVELDALIRENAPALKPADIIGDGMYGDMLGYGLVPYQSKSMKQPGEWPLIALKQQKNYISLYACVVTDGQYIAERYAPKLGKANCGKSCIRFKKIEDLNMDALKELLQEVNRRYEAGEKLFGQ